MASDLASKSKQIPQHQSSSAPKQMVRAAAPVHPILQLQRTLGNQVVLRLVESGQLGVGQSEPNATSGAPAQLQRDVGEAANHTGMPGRLRAGLEALSGMDLSAIRVHNNSSQPAQLNALAYTQGQDIHVGPGQEKHLPHEGWHAVQQMQGRVKPTMQKKGRSFNDDKELEREADVMGAKALQMPRAGRVATGFDQQGAVLVQRFEVSQENEIGRTGTQQPANELATVIQRDEDESDEPLLDMNAYGSHPGILAILCKEHMDEIQPVFVELAESYHYFDNVSEVYWGFFDLHAQLFFMEKDAKATEDQISRYSELLEKWAPIKERMEAANLRRTRARLKEAASATRNLQIQLTYAYRDIYAAGKEPEDVGPSSMKFLAETGVDLLKAINEADAAITGRDVAPIIPVLDKTLEVVELILGWKGTSGLAAESQKGMDALRNAMSSVTAGLSLGGFGKFLPLLAHIGPLLDGVAEGWSRVISGMRDHNRTWWQLRDMLGEDMQFEKALPGGKDVIDYMKAMFSASAPLKSKPSDDVFDFFDDNREMFSRTAKEVMGKKDIGVPAEISWFLESRWFSWRLLNANKLNNWAFYNKEMIWRLIYGRDMDFPD